MADIPSYCIECGGDLPTEQHLKQAVYTELEGTKGFICPKCWQYLKLPINLDVIENIYRYYYSALILDGKTEIQAKQHIKRFWLNIIAIKSYDLVSGHALNMVFRSVLKDFGIKKSADFYTPLKAQWHNFYFDEFNNLERVEKLNGEVKQ